MTSAHPLRTPVVAVVAVTLALLLGACSSDSGAGPGTPAGSSPAAPVPSSAPSAPGAAPSSVEGTWTADAEDGAEVYLAFAGDGSVSGKDGCNTLSGSYSTDGAEVALEDMASTLMYCEGVDTWLSQAVTVRIDGSTATALAEDGTELGTLRHQG